MRKVEASDRVLVKEMDGEAVLLDLTRETYFGLNGVGFRMWRALTSADSIAAALEELSREYDVPGAVLRDDALRLLDELERRGLVRVGRA